MLHCRWKKGQSGNARRRPGAGIGHVHISEKPFIVVLIGATSEGRNELVGLTDGARESAQDWRDLLLDLKRRGLRRAAAGSPSPMARARVLEGRR